MIQNVRSQCIDMHCKCSIVQRYRNIFVLIAICVCYFIHSFRWATVTHKWKEIPFWILLLPPSLFVCAASLFRRYFVHTLWTNLFVRMLCIDSTYTDVLLLKWNIIDYNTRFRQNGIHSNLLLVAWHCFPRDFEWHNDNATDRKLMAV